MRLFWQRASSIDRFLLLALVAGAAFTLNGIWWGWVECWNPDQMALRSLIRQGRGFLEPAEFAHPTRGNSWTALNRLFPAKRDV